MIAVPLVKVRLSIVAFVASNVATDDMPDAILILALIIPALKLPEPSLATIVPAVLASVALLVTVNVAAPELL